MKITSKNITKITKTKIGIKLIKDKKMKQYTNTEKKKYILYRNIWFF